MKILHVIDCMRIGGAQRRLFQLLKGLEDSNDITNYLVVFSDEVDFEGLHGLNVKLFIINSEKLISYKSFTGFKKIVAQVRPDIVHSWQLIVSFYSTILSFRFGFKHINAMINDSTRRSFFDKERLLARTIIPFADIIVSNSKAGLETYKVRLKKKVFVVYNGFDFERLNKRTAKPLNASFFNTEKERIIIGMVSRFENIKDYPTVIKAVCELLDRGARIKFVAIGDGNNLGSCKDLIPEKHKDSFLFLGKRSDIDNIVPLFDIGVLSSFSEGISNSIMEYMAFKKPVVATDCSGNREIVIHEQTGLLVGMRDKDDWVRKLLQLIEQEELRHFFGINGYNRLSDHFNLGRMVEEYKNLYYQFLKC